MPKRRRPYLFKAARKLIELYGLEVVARSDPQGWYWAVWKSADPTYIYIEKWRASFEEWQLHVVEFVREELCK